MDARKMADKKNRVSISLPQELLKNLKIYQQKQNLESSEKAIVAILQTFFEQTDDSNTYAPLDRLIQLETQVDRLTEQIASLQKFIVPSVAQMPVQFDRQHTKQKAIEPASSDDSYEDFADEPDEILTDFLE